MVTTFGRQKSDRQTSSSALEGSCGHGQLFIAQGLLDNELWEADISSPDSVIGEPLQICHDFNSLTQKREMIPCIC